MDALKLYLQNQILFQKKIFNFNECSKIPIQVLIAILQYMIVDKKDGIQISKIIKHKFNNVNINLSVLFKFMLTIRKAISNYLNIYI